MSGQIFKCILVAIVLLNYTAIVNADTGKGISCLFSDTATNEKVTFAVNSFDSNGNSETTIKGKFEITAKWIEKEKKFYADVKIGQETKINFSCTRQDLIDDWCGMAFIETSTSTFEYNCKHLAFKLSPEITSLGSIATLSD